MAEAKPKPGYKKTPPPKAPPKTDVPPGYGGGLDTGQAPEPELTPKQKAELKKQKEKAQNIAANYKENNRGGAPVDPAFVLAALQQGLSPNDIRLILNSQALGGPVTGPAYSSTELLDYFTDNPGEISGILDAVKASADAPATYAEYLAGGGEVGGYQPQNHLLQQGVLAIGGAKDAYLAGTTKAKWVAEGNDPNQWANHVFSQTEKPAPTGPSFIGGFDVEQVGSAIGMMLDARTRRQAAMSGTYFSKDELSGEVE